MSEVTVVRIYLKEGENRLNALLHFLHDTEAVSGLTAFRGIAGYGRSGTLHTTGLMDVSLHLPIVVEFFDEPEKVARILKDLHGRVDPQHVISWRAAMQ